MNPTLIDGAQAANKDIRGMLWAVSGKRAEYPQFFIRKQTSGATPEDKEEGEVDPSIKFIGDWQTVFGLNEREAATGELSAVLKPLLRLG